MEIFDWAYQILASDELEDKLFSPEKLEDTKIQKPYLFKEPARKPHMQFQKRKSHEKLPSIHDLKTSDNRAICLHRFCGHELLAVEIMAYVLLAFPDASPSFRKGVAKTLKEEQGHVRLYSTRMKELGLNFGDLPSYRHFWSHVPYIKSPSHYLSVMCLTFEMANLDFAPRYQKAFLQAEDLESSKVMQQIVKDEISHVSFGYGMLKKLHPESPDLWEVYKSSLSPLLTPKRARGVEFQLEPRKKARIPDNWIANLQNT